MMNTRCYVCGTAPLLSCKPDVLLCSQCGHAVRARSLSHSHNLEFQSAKFAETLGAPDPRAGSWPHRYVLVRREIKRLGITGGATLDIGCGNGSWLGSLEKHWEKHGVEVSPIVAEAARKHTGAKVYCGPIEEYASNRTFDLVTAFAVIEHLSEPRDFLVRCRTLVRKGGLLVLMTGDRESRVALNLKERWLLYHSPEHMHFFSARWLAKLLSDTGFHIVRQEWRFMYTSAGSTPLWARLGMKALEIAGFVCSPYSDHHYVYASPAN